jgi:hypothetical protein
MTSLIKLSSDKAAAPMHAGAGIVQSPKDSPVASVGKQALASKDKGDEKSNGAEIHIPRVEVPEEGLEKLPLFLKRQKEIADDRHAIRSPRNGVGAAMIWENTLMKERVATLFLTEAGFPGHLIALQNEVSRGKIAEGDNGTYVTALIQIHTRIYDAVIKVAKNATFKPKGCKLDFPLIQKTIYFK